MSGNYIYKTKSKTRTFEPGTFYHEIVGFVRLSIGMGAFCKTTEKYIVTVTKVIDHDTPLLLPKDKQSPQAGFS